jgi:hypothetical protein
MNEIDVGYINVLSKNLIGEMEECYKRVRQKNRFTGRGLNRVLLCHICRVLCFASGTWRYKFKCSDGQQDSAV